jgi:asparagine synthase (glutamine-hydrolysing)
MCGIYSCFHHGSPPVYRHDCIKPRGPDETKTIKGYDFTLVFYRLNIVGVGNGHQPFSDNGVYLMCNGEIYNHSTLENEHSIQCDTNSDCEIILHMYKKFGIEKTVTSLEGEFAFVIYDTNKKLVYFARDYIGIKPLYFSKTSECLEIASSINALSFRDNICHVKPNQLYVYDMNAKSLSIQPYGCLKYNGVGIVSHEYLYNSLLDSLRKRITQSERPVGFLLSGGLDSSTLLSMALEHKMIEKPEVFTFGFEENASDVKAATLMVEWLRSKYGKDCIKWHLVIQPLSSGIAVIPTVIKALETYDTTTIRASVPMYLISKYIELNTDIRVIISGEGADELFGGYLYFLYAPNNQAFRAEIIHLLNNLYLYDCLRADRVTAICGLEVRPPFLDFAFVNNVLLSKDLCCDKTTTKKLLRDILRSHDILPDDILNGKKEAFSDAVGLSWLDHVEEYSRKIFFSDEIIYSKFIEPSTCTSKYFQKLFSDLVGVNQWHLLKKLWLPNQDWVNTGGESSARILSVY